MSICQRVTHKFSYVFLRLFLRCVRDDYYEAFAEAYDVNTSLPQDDAYNFTEGIMEGNKAFCHKKGDPCNPALYRNKGVSYTCREIFYNPNHNFTNFDNIGWAMLSAFRLMTQVQYLPFHRLMEKPIIYLVDYR